MLFARYVIVDLLKAKWNSYIKKSFFRHLIVFISTNSKLVRKELFLTTKYRHRQFFAFSIYFCVSTIAFTLRHNQVEFLCVPLDGLWWLIHRSIKLDHLQVANDQHFPGDTVRLPSKWNNFQLYTLQFHFDEHHRRPGNGWRDQHCLN